ncbi:unnamed protein product, partial [Ectocarpus sp. 12 AP-2014]
MGEKFTNSALHNGLQLFIGRLLRPFWFLPVVVAPPGGGGGGGGAKRSADGTVKSGGSPPPPPFVRDLEALRVPLESLRASIRAVFPRAVSEDLAALASREAKAAAAHRNQKALKREALEVHAAYRLVSRAAEAVRMAGVLARAAASPAAGGSVAVDNVPWSSLDGVPLWRLVTGGDEHRRASCLLADLVGAITKGNSNAESLRDFARELGSWCRGFFGAGDRQTFEGVELLRRA